MPFLWEKKKKEKQIMLLLVEDMPDMPGQGKIAKCGTLGRLCAAVFFMRLPWTITKTQVFSTMPNSWLECC